MNLDRIITSSPINRQAATVTSQRGAVEADADLTKKEIAALIERLQRKLRLLKRVLGITTKVQHTNVMNRFKAGGLRKSKSYPRRAVEEYARVGQSIQILSRRCQELKAARRQLAKERNGQADTRTAVAGDPGERPAGDVAGSSGEEGEGSGAERSGGLQDASKAAEAKRRFEETWPAAKAYQPTEEK